MTAEYRSVTVFYPKKTGPNFDQQIWKNVQVYCPDLSSLHRPLQSPHRNITHKHKHTHTHTHIYIHTDIHTHTDRHTHACTHARAHTHTHTQTHSNPHRKK